MRGNQMLAGQSPVAGQEKPGRVRELLLGVLFVVALLTSTLDFNSLLP
ncbi:MAG: hypothetical protein U1F63_15795 [Chitinivorax sp.]